MLDGTITADLLLYVVNTGYTTKRERSKRTCNASWACMQTQKVVLAVVQHKLP